MKLTGELDNKKLNDDGMISVDNLPEDLTPEQEAKLPEYQEKWLNIALKTGPVIRSEAEAAFKDAYVAAELNPDNLEVHWTRSPVEMVEKAKELSDKAGSTYSLSELNNAVCYGQFDANWLGFYEFFLKEIKVRECQLLEPLMRVAQNCFWFIAFENPAVIVACERPTVFKVNEQYQLHNPDDFAIEFADGRGIYMSNGVEMPEDIITTPAKDIPVNRFFSETNVEVRREILRKIGMERIAAESEYKVLDTYDPNGSKEKPMYELVTVNLGSDLGHCNYLKMLNPSIDAIHMEGVPNTVTTCEGALAWRNGLGDGNTFTPPKLLS